VSDLRQRVREREASVDTSPSSSFTTPDHDANGINAAGADPDGVAGAVRADSAQLLFTPAQAATALQVRESWLRRRAASRQLPCTFLGKHLRFSRADLDQIVTDAARRVTARPSGGGHNASPRRLRRRQGPGER
jgi:excisionase family DNA binding protein